MVKPWSRVATSLTGRPSRRAASAIQAVRAVARALASRSAPPTKRETTRTSVRVDAELLGDAAVQAVHELARLVDGQLGRRPRRRWW